MVNPTAPVQDDDAERPREFYEAESFVTILREDADFVRRNSEAIAPYAAGRIEHAAAFIERIANRLSPTPDTGLIERVAGAIQRHFMAKHGGPIGPDYAKTCAEAAITALANASPAQVESGK